MDLDFDDEPSKQAAPAARAGARFKPKARPVPKKKQVSFSSTSQTTNLSTTDSTNEKLSTTQSEDNPVSVDETLSEKVKGDIQNVDVTAEGVNWSKEQPGLRACTEKRSEDNITEEAPAITDDPRTQDSTTFGDFVTPETDEDTHAQREGEEEECHLDMETLDIVQEEGTTTNAYAQHSGKFQPKPRVVLETVIEEEPESHYSVDDNNNGYFTNESEHTVNVESRNDDFNTNTTFDGDFQDEVPREHGEQVSNNTVPGEEEERSERESNKTGGKSKRPASRKRKSKIEKDPEKSTSENPEKKKKFKHATRRQKRTLEKELLETPDDEIRFLPIRDMLRLVEYKEWLEKKEGKGAPVVPPTQESNVNASDYNNPYYSQGFDEEDEFAMEETENQETAVVKPDSPVNYQTYMNKTSRTRWSKQDTELFYEGIREFGSNLSMVQQLFPSKTREQIKLKFKSEERKYPLKLNDALSSRSKHLIHFHTVIKKLQEEAAAAKEGEEDEEEQEDEAETTTDVPENEEPAKTEETERSGGVKESDGGDVENGVRSDGGDQCGDAGDDEDDDDFWNSYKSEL